MRKPQAVFLTLALGAAGCMPTMATGPGSTPETGTPRGEGFCEGKAQEAPGRVVKCEDFRGVQEGTLPSGWIGGEGMMVKPSAQVNGAKILTGFEPKDSYQITIPWKFGGDYRVDAMIRPKSSFDLTVGNVVVRSTIRHHLWGGLDSWMVSINRLSPTGGEPEGSGTEARVDKDQPKNDIAATFHLVTVTKQGPIYRLLVDGRQLALVRYQGLPDPEAITFVSHSRSGGFGVAGIKVEGGTYSQPAPSPAPASAPRPAP